MAVFYRLSWRKKNETSGRRIENNRNVVVVEEEENNRDVVVVEGHNEPHDLSNQKKPQYPAEIAE